jgi:hypothetical protein
VRNGELSHRVKVERNILHQMKRRKANWIVHICLLEYVIGGKIKERIVVTERRGRRG